MVSKKTLVVCYDRYKQWSKKLPHMPIKLATINHAEKTDYIGGFQGYLILEQLSYENNLHVPDIWEFFNLC